MEEEKEEERRRRPGSGDSENDHMVHSDGSISIFGKLILYSRRAVHVCCLRSADGPKYHLLRF